MFVKIWHYFCLVLLSLYPVKFIGNFKTKMIVSATILEATFALRPLGYPEIIGAMYTEDHIDLRVSSHLRLITDHRLINFHMKL